jgi:phytoene synthase
MAFEVARAREFFAQGRALPEKVRGRLRWELRFTWQGGVSILDKIERAGYDVFSRRPVVTMADWFGIAVRSLF